MYRLTTVSVVMVMVVMVVMVGEIFSLLFFQNQLRYIDSSKFKSWSLRATIILLIFRIPIPTSYIPIVPFGLLTPVK